MKKKKEENTPRNDERGEETPEYTPPTVKSYSSDEILEEIGPAQACTSSPCGTYR